MRRLIAIAALAAGLGLAVSLALLARDIEQQSWVDEARPADVIVVLGAAEYRGSPSPVLRARLDHALELHKKGLAPRILTTGGAGGDGFTEGEVSRDYLVKCGMPSEQILVEAEGDSTVSSLTAVGEIMRRTGLHSAILVSDGYHIYRAKKILASLGVNVYGSPRRTSGKGTLSGKWLYLRQALGYWLWRVGINV